MWYSMVIFFPFQKYLHQTGELQATMYQSNIPTYWTHFIDVTSYGEPWANFNTDSIKYRFSTHSIQERYHFLLFLFVNSYFGNYASFFCCLHPFPKIQDPLQIKGAPCHYVSIKYSHMPNLSYYNIIVYGDLPANPNVDVAKYKLPIS